MKPFEMLTLIISLLALISCIWIGIRQNRLQERMFNLETQRERDRKKAATSASLRAYIEHDQDYRLIITNDGSGMARSIKTLVDSKPVLSHGLVPRGLCEITELGSGAKGSYLLAVSMGVEPLISVALTWQDDSGEPGQWSSQLNLF